MASTSTNGVGAAPRGRPRDPELPARRREQILRTATRLFAKRGFSNTDLQDVADALKVGKGTIYRYFPSKQALFHAGVERVLKLMRKTIDDSIAEVKDPLDQIVVAIHTYLRFFHDHPEYVEMIIQDRAQGRSKTKPSYFTHREANMKRWHDLYKGLMRDGRIREMRVERITNVLGDLVYGAMFTNYMSGRSASLVDQAGDIIDLVFHGLLTPEERSRPHVLPREVRS